MSRPSRLLALAVGALVAAVPGAQAAVPRVLKPAHHTHVLEGGAATITISLPTRTRRPVSVSWATRPGSAFAGRDYVSAHGRVTIPKGRRTASLQVRTLRDHFDEITEEFHVQFSEPDGAPLLGRTRTIVRVIDRNPAFASVAPRVVAEPAAAGDTTPIGAVVRISGGSAGTRPVAIGYEITPVEPTVNDSDATLRSGILHFRRGEVAKVIPGIVKGDSVDEVDEHLLITLTGARGVYARLGASITIADDPGDTPPTVSIGDISAPENSSGAVEVPITLSGPSERPVTVSYATSPGTAGVDDFVMQVGTITFPIGATSREALVALDDDTVDEPAETFTITLSNPIDATIDRGVATFTITDEDPPPIIGVTNTVVNEGDHTATVTVKLSQPSEQTVGVVPTIASHSARFGAACETSDGDADPVDVLTPPDDLTITLPPGSTTAAIVLTVCDDFASEPDELVSFEFGSPVNAVLGATTAEVRILANDPLPEITVEDAAVSESDELAVLTLRLDHASGNTVTVHAALTGYTATFGAACSQDISDPDPPDVITPSGNPPVSFPPGSTEATIELQLCDDEMPFEPDEFVDYHFDTPVNATLGNAAASVRIVDNDDM